MANSHFTATCFLCNGVFDPKEMLTIKHPVEDKSVMACPKHPGVQGLHYEWDMQLEAAWEEYRNDKMDRVVT